MAAGGSTHWAVVAEDGRLCVWGEGRSGRLGLGHTTGACVDKALPTVVESLEHVVQAACGFAHSLAVTEDGSLFSWGFGRYGATDSGEDAWVEPLPRRVDLGNEFAVHCAAGYYHSAAVTQRGELFTWGAGDDGQLGTGDFAHQFAPTKVALPCTVEMVACGMSHTAAVSTVGDVWCWGETGEMDGSDVMADRRAEPRLVTFPSAGGDALGCSVRVVSVACGFSHTLCVDTDGGLWSWGEGSLGRLGHGDEDSRTIPCLVGARRFAGRRVSTTAAGGYHSAAVCQDGTLWTFGAGVERSTRRGLADACARDSLREQNLGPVDDGGKQVSPDERQSRLGHWGGGEEGHMWGSRSRASRLVAVGALCLQIGANVLVPVQVDAAVLRGMHVVGVAASAQHTLAMLEDGTLVFLGKTWSSTHGQPVCANPQRVAPPDCDDEGVMPEMEEARCRQAPHEMTPRQHLRGMRAGRCHAVSAPCALAFAMATHRRLGAACGLMAMPEDLVRQIVQQTRLQWPPATRHSTGRWVGVSRLLGCETMQE